MTIDEAVETLKKEQHEHHSLNVDTIGKAMLLGIQALERVELHRTDRRYPFNTLLPGETES